MRPNEYVQLVISEKPGGSLAWVITNWANAQRLGWLEHFKPMGQHLSERSPNGLVCNRALKTGGSRPGYRIVIGKGSDHHRPGPGARRQLRVNKNCSLFDLAELLHFTSGDWDWMTTTSGVVRTREQWECIYEAARF